MYHLRLFESPTDEDRKEQTSEGHKEIRSQMVAEIEEPGGHAAQGTENPAQAENQSRGLPPAHLLLVNVIGHSRFQHRYRRSQRGEEHSGKKENRNSRTQGREIPSHCGEDVGQCLENESRTGSRFDPGGKDRRHNGKTGYEREYQVKNGCVESCGNQILFLLHVGSIGQNDAYSQREGEEGLAHG